MSLSFKILDFEKKNPTRIWIQAFAVQISTLTVNHPPHCLFFLSIRPVYANKQRKLVF